MKKITYCALGLIIFLMSYVSTLFANETKTALKASLNSAPPEISVFWILPFAAILLCIAIIPLINAHYWEKNLWWISLGIFCLPMTIIFSLFMGHELRMLTFEKARDYISFIILLASLFVISGGILIKGSFTGTPMVNSIFLFIGSIIASFIGTTGASMLLVRPLIRANNDRNHKAHVIIFFIFLVSNIGGVLTPLGDPPLFLGYLQGIPFEWTLRLAPHWVITCSIVLSIFFLMDTYLYKKENSSKIFRQTIVSGGNIALNKIKNEITEVFNELNVNKFKAEGKISLRTIKNARNKLIRILQSINMLLSNPGSAASSDSFAIEGKINLALISGVVLIVYLQGLLLKKFPGTWPQFGPQECGMAILLVISLILTPVKSKLRKENGFTFQPIKEVAFLFAGIFAAMIPALYILEHKGAALGITKPWQFFWATGGLSSFLDNAPTYLTFLSLAKGLKLQNDLGFVLNDGGGLTTAILTAISCGAVFMGANSYIGNGPNFMVKSIAEEQGIKMPSFFGYMVYSCAVLIPTFFLITLIFFR